MAHQLHSMLAAAFYPMEVAALVSRNFQEFVMNLSVELRSGEMQMEIAVDHLMLEPMVVIPGLIMG